MAATPVRRLRRLRGQLAPPPTFDGWRRLPRPSPTFLDAVGLAEEAGSAASTLQDREAARRPRWVTALVVHVDAEPLPQTVVVAVSVTALAAAGLTSGNDTEDDAAAAAALATDTAFAEFMAGKRPAAGWRPWASNYAGHQFGVFVPQLGDGRALSLAEIVNSRGEPWEIQLKGAGRTPFSRGSDGRAVLRSSIREFLCSEAMAALGVPTTRALALAASPETVFRERPETAAIVCRLAPTFVRFGTFELLAQRGEAATMARLAEFVRVRCCAADVVAGDYAGLLGWIAVATARTFAHWHALGFVHGVLNTDNMSIAGLTLDYGPFGFLDVYDPTWTSNSSDDAARYRFAAQPQVGLWNIERLADALALLVPVDHLRDAVARYIPALRAHYLALMRARLGLETASTTMAAGADEDTALVGDLLAWMVACGDIDYNGFLRAFAEDPPTEGQDAASVPRWGLSAAASAALAPWLVRYCARVATLSSSAQTGAAARAVRTRAANPKYLLRNHIADSVIDPAQRGNFGPLRRLLAVLARPYDDHGPDAAAWATGPPPERRGRQCSCSS